MTDPRIETLAKNLIGFSCNVQAGENVLIETYGDCDALLLALIRAAYAAGANPFVWRRDNAVQRAIAMGATDGQLALMAQVRAENQMVRAALSFPRHGADGEPFHRGV